MTPDEAIKLLSAAEVRPIERTAVEVVLLALEQANAEVDRRSGSLSDEALRRMAEEFWVEFADATDDAEWDTVLKFARRVATEAARVELSGQRCQAKALNGKKCKSLGAVAQNYHGDSEIYGYDGPEPSWVRVYLCAKHRRTRANQRRKPWGVSR